MFASAYEKQKPKSCVFAFYSAMLGTFSHWNGYQGNTATALGEFTFSRAAIAA